MADSKRKTANLFDDFDIVGQVPSVTNGNLVNYTNGACTELIDLPSGLLTLSIYETMIVYVFLYDANKSFLGWVNLPSAGTRTTQQITNYENAKYARVRTDNYSTYLNEKKIMLNSGSTAKPYEPYGWQHSLRKLGTSTDTITTLPADLYADGTNATVGLVGNMSQTGSPTPQNPIQPQETGDMTGNLFDEVYPDISVTIRYRPIYVGNGTFTLSTTTPYTSSVANVFLLSGDVTSGASTPNNGVWLNHNVTAQSDGGYITIAYRQYVGTTSPVDCQTMLNTGSTALPYEPNGVKIPISSANTTTPVYLGEVQTTRKIKKLVLTGQENWTSTQIGSQTAYYIILSSYTLSSSTRVCTHLPSSAISSSSAGNVLRFFVSSDFATLEDWQAFLSTQYANGTPVCVWYVIATTTTGIVNEPLRKIGDYADTVSGITIPTITGKDTVDVLTTLKPSEVELTYTGWHDAIVHEKSRNLFDKTVATLSYYVDSSTGDLVGGNTYFASDYIEVEQGEEYYWNDIKRGNAGAFYDSNKTYISGWNSSQTRYIFTVPSGAKYVRLTGDKANIDTYMLSKGSTELPYEPYWK